MQTKPQRIRDPLHNLVDFGPSQFEQTLWKVIQSPPFQRLRRVRQLGFSELIYPGATHTRFAHSIGTYHIARNLMRIIRQHIESEPSRQFGDHQAEVAVAAALVHDVGHGMFSHAFEEIGKKMDLQMARHEHVSDRLIRESEISDAFRELGSGFANDVADVIGQGRPGNLYDAVVSSQFDADRLDYMQRDRFMTGVQNSGIDFVWLMNNLQIADVPVGADDQQSGTVATFVLGPKAIHAAETYVLALFQLYPTVYFHKATRGAEKIFTSMMLRIFELVRDDSVGRTGLTKNHPIIKFASDSASIEHALALDDTVFWGSLPMLMAADDPLIYRFAKRLWSRNLFKCIDVYQEIERRLDLNKSNGQRDEARKKIDRIAVSIQESLEDYLIDNPFGNEPPRYLIDHAVRHPYSGLHEPKEPLNQIMVMQGDKVFDMADMSPVVAGLRPFSLFRVYFDLDDVDTGEFIKKVISEKIDGDKE